MRGVCSRFNIDDIVYYPKRYEQAILTQTDRQRIINFEKTFSCKALWVMTPNTDKKIRAILGGEPSPAQTELAEVTDPEEDVDPSASISIWDNISYMSSWP